MEINSKYMAAADACLENNIPFTLFALPGEEFFRFFASVPDSEGESHAFEENSDADTFFINFFDNDEPYTAGVKRQFDADSIWEYISSAKNLPLPQPLIHPSISSTHRVSYDNAFSHVKPRLKQYGGKVVLSQHQSVISARPILQVVMDYFSKTSTTFRDLGVLFQCRSPALNWLMTPPCGMKRILRSTTL